MKTLLDCGHEESAHSEFTTGYGTDAQGKKHCYECCAENDRNQMGDEGRITLYLSKKRDSVIIRERYAVTNWPGSLSFDIDVMRIGYHNIARTRYDVWFHFEGTRWHGVQYGDNTQICHCKRIK